MAIGPLVNDTLIKLIGIERRFDPHFRPAFDRVFQRPIAHCAQWVVRRLHPSRETRLCQEMEIPGETKAAEDITALMSRFTEQRYSGGRTAERAGNTKTYGVVRAECEIFADIPAAMRHGVFAEPHTYPAWIRFGGPGPLSPPDVEDSGILSMSIKLMGVPGPKLMDDERLTQDLLMISSPTFTTPDVIENVKLQKEIGAGTPIFYFLKPTDSHLLDLIMQGLYARMNTSPLEVRYWSCVPYLCGEGQAMKYSVRPRSHHRTKVPWKVPTDWLRRSSSTSCFNYRPTLKECPSKTPAWNGRNRFRRSFPSRKSAFPRRSSPLRRRRSLRASSPTTPGMRSPSIVRSAIRTASAC